MTEHDPSKRRGTLLGGRYRVGETLGQGGMGAVYEAIQEDLGRRVAVKVLHPHLAFQADGLQRFRLEAQSAAALGHPNIVQVTDFQANAGEPAFLVMEHLEGRSLAQTIAAEGPLPAARVAFIVAQMLSGLSAAHGANIVHRDIKPDNVFLTSTTAVEDLVKLLDFGIAKLQGDTANAQLTAAGTMIGTPAYMSPEQARGLPIDARTDLYAVGTCMYHALSGRLPFDANSLPALLVAIFEQAPVPLASLCPGIDPRMEALVARAMAKDPAARFASAEEMRVALSPWSRPSAKPPSFRADFAATSPIAYTTPPTPAMPMAHERVVQAASASVAPSAARGKNAGRAGLLVGALAAIALAAVGVTYVAWPRNRVVAEARGEAVRESTSRPLTAPTPASSTSAVTGAAIAPPAHHATSVVRAASANAEALAVPAPRPTSTAAAAVVPGAREGKAASFSGMDPGVYGGAPLRTGMEATLDAATRCMAKFPPPDSSPSFFASVTADGVVTEVGNMNGASAPRNPSLDRCMQGVFEAMHLGRPSSAGVFRVSYSFR